MTDDVVLERLRNAAALGTWALEPQSADLDSLASGLIEDLATGDHLATVAAYSSLVATLLDRLSAATGRAQDQLWREITLTIPIPGGING
jgi:hypothetical protein